MIITVLDENKEPLDPQRDPVSGDLVEVDYGKYTAIKQYNPDEFSIPEPEEPSYEMSTIEWLREHFTSAREAAARTYALGNHAHSLDVRVALEMVNARIDGTLELDDPIYATGMALFRSVGIIESDEAARTLIELGGHDSLDYIPAVS